MSRRCELLPGTSGEWDGGNANFPSVACRPHAINSLSPSPHTHSRPLTDPNEQIYNRKSGQLKNLLGHALPTHCGRGNIAINKRGQ